MPHTALIFVAILVIVTALFIYIYRESKGFRVTQYNLYTDKKIGKNLDFVVLSDLHDTDLGNNNSELISAIDRISPDFILLAGDMITSYMQPSYNSEKTFDFLKRLSSKYRIYYGLGNHEQRYYEEPQKFNGKFEELVSNVGKMGIELMSDRYCDIGDNVRVYGLNIPMEYYRRVVDKPLPSGYVGSVLGECDKSKYNILLAHTPDQFEEYVKWGPDLVLSGHVHGGIVRLPGLGGVISPQLKLFPQYDWGHFEQDGVEMILSCGIGWHTIPIRMWNKAELVHITVSYEEASHSMCD